MRVRLRAADGRFVLGPGKAALLAGVRDLGSIAAAARALGMSYRRAWSLVAAMNRDFPAPLVEARHGGACRGGASLTPQGRRVLAAWDALEAALAGTAANHVAQLVALIAPDGGPPDACPAPSSPARRTRTSIESPRTPDG